MELEHVYVSLRAQLPDTDLGREQPPALEIDQAMAQRKRLAILGGPGTGKTTLLAYLTLTYARGQARKRLGLREKPLPILVPLRQLRSVLGGPKGTSTLPAYLVKRFTELGMHPREGFFEKRLRDGRCLVLLDGLDEVADEAERRQMADWVDQLVTVYPENRYIVTSRPPGYVSAPLGNGFTELHIREFGATEIQQFAENWCLAVEMAAQGEDNPTARRQASSAAQDLVAAIQGNADIRKLAVNPLLLSIIALVHRYRPLPRRRVDLYAECVDVLLGHWDAAKGLAGELSPAQKRAVLQPVAFQMHIGGVREIPRSVLESRIEALLPKVGGTSTEAYAFLEAVRERSGLLVEIGLGVYAFSHLSFQEYLAALEIAENENLRALLLNNAGDEWWQEVTLLYAGMVDATPVVKALLADGDDDTCSRLLLAGRCVAEAKRVDEDSRARVLQRLQQSFATCTGEQFLRTGQVLADIAGDDSVDFFLRLARDDIERGDASLWALGQMGRQSNEALRERVIDRLLEEYDGGEFKVEALEALATAWSVDTLDEFAARGLSDPYLTQRADTPGAVLDALMVKVPAGEFLMGDDKRAVHVETFRIDKYPVTNAQYKRFVDITDHALPRGWVNGDYPEGKGTHPVVNVTWDDVWAYAEWAGKQLPTEEQWEKAARGTDGRDYPWGDWKSDRCNTSEANVGGTTRVGQYSPDGDSPYGCADMAGNVWEWTATEYEGEPGRRVVRGGSWLDAQRLARCASRYRVIADYSNRDIGFRCVSPI